jgi:YbgC/YbaW family acyl-CoA thioester hydrolase
MSTTLPAIPRLTVALEVYYFDTDAGGVVHNIAYLRMVEIARSQLAASLGWTLEEMNRTGLVPVVARTEIDYLRPARLGDSLRNHVGRETGAHFHPLHADDGHRAASRRKTAARATVVAGCVSAVTSEERRARNEEPLKPLGSGSTL